MLVRRRPQLRFEPGRGGGERLLELIGRYACRRIGARDTRLQRLRRLGDLFLEIREALLEGSLGSFAAFDVPVEIGEPLLGGQLDPDGAAVVVEAAQIGSRGRRAPIAIRHHALHEHADLARALGIKRLVALLRLLVQVGDERARLFDLLGRRRVDARELLEQRRVVADCILQLGNPLAGDVVEGGRLFVGGTPHVGPGLRRLRPQRVLELDEPLPQRLFEGHGLLCGGLAYGVLRRDHPLVDAPGFCRRGLLDLLPRVHRRSLDRLGLAGRDAP
jgi:hypothetical protein